MDSPFPLCIPLDRISHRETPTIKSELIPWIHITGRQDLCAIFEKESITTTLGFIEQRTAVKIKSGVKAVDTLVLEDFVCQAAVQERRHLSSPTDPAHFAIFVSCPNIAFRYRLVNGYFRKIQILFKDAAGYEMAIKVLESFNLPLIYKGALSQGLSSTADDALSISTRLSMAPPTIFSRASWSAGTSTTAQTRRTSTMPLSVHRYRNDRPVSRQSSTYQRSIGIVRPGPSLIEPIIEANDEPHHSRWRSCSIFGKHDNNNPLLGDRAIFNTVEEDILEQAYNPRRRDKNMSYRHYTNTPFSHLEHNNLPWSENSKEVPVSSQRRQYDWIDKVSPSISKMEDTRVTRQGSKSVTDSTTLSDAALAVVTKNAIKTIENRQNEKENIGPTKIVSRKKQPKKVFKTLGIQTESSSISKATQTYQSHTYASRSIQTESAVAVKDRITIVETPDRIDNNEVPAKAIQILNDKKKLHHNFPSSPLSKKYRLPINKFGQGRRRVPLSCWKAPDMVRLEIEYQNNDCVNFELPQRPLRGINKFGRARGRIC